MKYLSYIIILLLFCSLGYAIPVTTFQRQADGDFSLVRDDYLLIVGELEGTGKCFEGFDNTSLFYTSSSGSSATTWNRGKCSVNGTRTGGYVEDYFTSGMEAGYFSGGMCMDVTFGQMTGTYTTDINVGFSDVRRCGNTAGEVCFLADGNQGNVWSLHTGDGNDYVASGEAVVSDKLHNFTLVYNTSNSYLYFNNGDTNSVTAAEASEITNFTISITSEHTIGFNLTYLAIYNCSLGAPAGAGDTTPPTIAIANPTNNSYTNTLPLSFEITASDDLETTLGCSLGNESQQLDSDTFTSGVQNTLSYNPTNAERDITFNITCWDNSDNNNSASLVWNVSIDTINPVMSIHYVTQGRDYDKRIENISYALECSDNYLYTLNTTFFNVSQQIESEQNITYTETRLTQNSSFDLTNVALGSYSINFSCSDSHTLREINDYDVRVNNTQKRIEFKDEDTEIVITLVSSDKFYTPKRIQYQKQGDRYSFEFGKAERQDFIFEIRSNKNIKYLKDTGFNAHFVTGRNWIDFENGDKDFYLRNVNKLNDYTYRITINTDTLDFMSIGGLNIVTQQLNISVSETSLTSDLFDVKECPETTSGALLYVLFFGFAGFLILLGFVFRVGFLGLFGALILLTSSLYIMACVFAIAIILSLLSILLILYFVLIVPSIN